MTLTQLRKLVPAWTWTAVRDGFGWNYEGRLGDRLVSVEVRSEGEDCGSAWWVYDEARRGERLLFWAMRGSQ